MFMNAGHIPSFQHLFYSTSTPVFRKPADVAVGRDTIDIRKTPLKTPIREEYRVKEIV